MAVETELESEGPTPVVVRRATGSDVPRLRAEGERLLRAAHPGVVQVVSSEGDDEAWELRTLHGGRPLTVAAPLTAEALAGVAAAAATTLADLHAVGVVHGRLRADHILLGPHGRPVLCGFGPGPGLDDVAPDPTPADDVAAVGSILSELLGDAADAEPVPERRWRRRDGWSGWVRRSLLTLADQACAEPPSRRPSARRFAAAIVETVPDARAALDDSLTLPAERVPDAIEDPIEALRATADRPARSREGIPARRLLVRTGALAMVLGIGLVALGTVGVATGPGAAHRAADPTASGAGAPASSTNPVPTTDPPAAPVETTSQPPLPPPCAVRGAPPASAPFGCDRIKIDGTTVTVGHRRFQVGQPGDHIAIGDWDCDGTVSPAVLRPATGRVFIFPAWVDHEVTVDPIAEVPGATALVSDDAGNGCHVLGVRLHTGEVVDLTRTEPS